jgi:hypothetical protein
MHSLCARSTFVPENRTRTRKAGIMVNLLRIRSVQGALLICGAVILMSAVETNKNSKKISTKGRPAIPASQQKMVWEQPARQKGSRVVLPKCTLLDLPFSRI